MRSAPGRCVRATKTCHAIHLGKTWPSFPWSSGAAVLVTGTLGPTLSSRQRLPRRGKLRLSTLQTLFCQQPAHAFTPQLSLENKNFLKSSISQFTNLARLLTFFHNTARRAHIPLWTGRIFPSLKRKFRR